MFSLAKYLAPVPGSAAVSALVLARRRPPSSLSRFPSAGSASLVAAVTFRPGRRSPRCWRGARRKAGAGACRRARDGRERGTALYFDGLPLVTWLRPCRATVERRRTSRPSIADLTGQLPRSGSSSATCTRVLLPTPGRPRARGAGARARDQRSSCLTSTTACLRATAAPGLVREDSATVRDRQGRVSLYVQTFLRDVGELKRAA